MYSHLHSENNINNWKGIIATILIHSLLLFFFFLVTFESPPPPEPQIEGMLINLGNSHDGSGVSQPLRTGDYASDNSSHPSNKAASTNTAEGYMTQKLEDNIALTHTENPSLLNPNTKVEETINENKVVNNNMTNTAIVSQPKINENALFKVKNASGTGGNNSNANNNSTYDGNGNGIGDKGAINGDPNAANYGNWSNGLDDKGPGLAMNGRKFIQKPLIQDNSQETGILILKIKVNKEGKVVSADYYPKGSTTSNRNLINKAIMAVKKSYLNESDKAEQIGLVRINFKVE